MQTVADALEHVAQVVRPYQVDHHLEPDALRGSEQFLYGQYAPRDGDGNLIPLLNAEAVRVDTLRSQMIAGEALKPQKPTTAAIFGPTHSDEALTDTRGDMKRVSSVPAPATDGAGKPLMLPGQVAGEPAWMSAARSAGWTPSEPAWMSEARRAGWTTQGGTPQTVNVQPQSQATPSEAARQSAIDAAQAGRPAPDYSQLTAVQPTTVEPLQRTSEPAPYGNAQPGAPAATPQPIDAATEQSTTGRATTPA